jgi:flagellar biosynthesis protein FliR
VDPVTFQLPWQSALSGVALIMRAGGFCAVAPIYGADSVPTQIRAALAVMIALVLSPVVPAPPASSEVLWLISSEMLVGLLIGFVTHLLFDMLLFAGTFIGYPTGLSMASMMDPLNQSQTATGGLFYQIVGALLFLGIGGHRQVLGALARSYEIVPAGLARFDGPWIKTVASMTGEVLVIGFRLAAPVLVAGILCDLCLMLVARAVPQMNILIVGAPVRLAVGLVALAASLHVIAPVMADSLDTFLHGTGRLVQSLAGRG